MKKEFDIGKCFSEGWALFQKNMGVLILGYLLVSVVSFFTCFILFGPLLVGFFLMVDRLIKNDPEKPNAGDVFKGMSKFGAAFVAVILFVVVAMIAGVIPVIGQIASYVVSPLLMFTIMYIAFEDLGTVDAFKKVINGITSGEMLMPVLLGIIANLIGGAGLLLCLVGGLFTMPFAMTLYVCAYQQMKSGDGILDAEIIMDTAPPHAPEPSDDEPPTVG